MRPAGAYTITDKGTFWDVTIYLPGPRGAVTRQRTRWGKETSGIKTKAAAVKEVLRRVREAADALEYQPAPEAPEAMLVERLAWAQTQRLKRCSGAKSKESQDCGFRSFLAFWIAYQDGWRSADPKVVRKVYQDYPRFRLGTPRRELVLGLAQQRDLPLSQFTREMAEEYQAWRMMEAAASTTNSSVKQLRGLFEDLEEYVPRNPFRRILPLSKTLQTDGARISPTRSKVFTLEDQALLFDALWTRPLYSLKGSKMQTRGQRAQYELALFVEIQARTGARLDQVHSLNGLGLSGFDPAANRLDLKPQKRAPGQYFPCDDELAAICWEWIREFDGRWSYAAPWYGTRVAWIMRLLSPGWSWSKRPGDPGPCRNHGWRHTLNTAVVNVSDFSWGRMVLGHSSSAEGVNGGYFHRSKETEDRIREILSKVKHPRPASRSGERAPSSEDSQLQNNSKTSPLDSLRFPPDTDE